MGSFKLRSGARLEIDPREPAAVVDVVLARDLAVGRHVDPEVDLFAHDFDDSAIENRPEPRAILTHRLRVTRGRLRRAWAAAFP